MGKDKQDRLDKLREMIRYNEIVHTNPVMIGMDDLRWIVAEISRLRFLVATEQDREVQDVPD